MKLDRIGGIGILCMRRQLIEKRRNGYLEVLNR